MLLFYHILPYYETLIKSIGNASLIPWIKPIARDTVYLIPITVYEINLSITYTKSKHIENSFPNKSFRKLLESYIEVPIYTNIK